MLRKAAYATCQLNALLVGRVTGSDEMAAYAGDRRVVHAEGGRVAAGAGRHPSRLGCPRL